MPAFSLSITLWVQPYFHRSLSFFWSLTYILLCGYVILLFSLHLLKAFKWLQNLCYCGQCCSEQGVWLFLQHTDFRFLGYNSPSWDSWTYGSSSFSLVMNHHHMFHNGYPYIPINTSVPAFPFPTSSPTLALFHCFEKSCSNRCDEIHHTVVIMCISLMISDID